MSIPQRFVDQINAHLMGNYLQIENYPLILAIMGKPGTGKTWQLRTLLCNYAIEIYSISSADLESDKAGQPAKLLKTKYVDASLMIKNKKKAALVIDDIDTTVGEWENNTGTVNHQSILAFLMHLADNPYYIEEIGSVNRVPIFITGNQFERLYEPLRRPERTTRFDWEPSLEEKESIIASVFKVDIDTAKKINNLFPEESIAFFSEKYAHYNRLFLAKKCNAATLSRILSDEVFRNSLKNEYLEYCSKTDWLNEFLKRE